MPEEIQKANEPIDNLIEEGDGSSMSLYSIDHLCIKAHPNIIGEHLFKALLSPLNLSLIFDVPDGSVVKGFHFYVPHVIISNCRIHPLFYQCSKTFKIISSDFDRSRAPTQTATEVVACSNRNDPDYYLTQIYPYCQQLGQDPWDRPISSANHDPTINVCITIQAQDQLKSILSLFIAEQVEEEQMGLFTTLVFYCNLVASQLQIVGSVSISALGIDKEHEMHLLRFSVHANIKLFDLRNIIPSNN